MTAHLQPVERVPIVRFAPAEDLLEKPMPLQWLIRGVLLAGATVTMIGAPGTFKSNIALDVAASIAVGLPWHEHATKRGAVFFLAGEGNHGLARRLKAWTIVQGRSLEGVPLFVSAGGVGLIDPMNAAAVSAEVQRIAAEVRTDPVLVVIDTLARCFGPGDENSTADMSKFIASIDIHLRQHFGCAVLIVHHSGVMDNGRGRGSSALRAAVDTEIVCERTDRTVTLRCTKSKDAPEFEPMALEARTVELPWNDDEGEPETSFAMFKVDAPAARSEATATGMGGNQRKALEILREMYAECRGNLSKAGHDPAGALVRLEDWRARSGLGHKRFPEVKAALEQRGSIVIDSPHVRLA